MSTRRSARDDKLLLARFFVNQKEVNNDEHISRLVDTSFHLEKIKNIVKEHNDQALGILYSKIEDKVKRAFGNSVHEFCEALNAHEMEANAKNMSEPLKTNCESGDCHALGYYMICVPLSTGNDKVALVENMNPNNMTILKYHSGQLSSERRSTIVFFSRQGKQIVFGSRPTNINTPFSECTASKLALDIFFDFSSYDEIINSLTKLKFYIELAGKTNGLRVCANHEKYIFATFWDPVWLRTHLHGIILQLEVEEDNVNEENNGSTIFEQFIQEATDVTLKEFLSYLKEQLQEKSPALVACCHLINHNKGQLLITAQGLMILKLHNLLTANAQHNERINNSHLSGTIPSSYDNPYIKRQILAIYTAGHPNGGKHGVSLFEESVASGESFFERRLKKKFINDIMLKTFETGKIHNILLPYIILDCGAGQTKASLILYNVELMTHKDRLHYRPIVLATKATTSLAGQKINLVIAKVFAQTLVKDKLVESDKIDVLKIYEDNYDYIEEFKIQYLCAAVKKYTDSGDDTPIPSVFVTASNNDNEAESFEISIPPSAFLGEKIFGVMKTVFAGMLKALFKKAISTYMGYIKVLEKELEDLNVQLVALNATHKKKKGKEKEILDQQISKNRRDKTNREYFLCDMKSLNLTMQERNKIVTDVTYSTINNSSSMDIDVGDGSEVLKTHNVRMFVCGGSGSLFRYIQLFGDRAIDYDDTDQNDSSRGAFVASSRQFLAAARAEHEQWY